MKVIVLFILIFISGSAMSIECYTSGGRLLDFGKYEDVLADVSSSGSNFSVKVEPIRCRISLTPNEVKNLYASGGYGVGFFQNVNGGEWYNNDGNVAGLPITNPYFQKVLLTMKGGDSDRDYYMNFRIDFPINKDLPVREIIRGEQVLALAMMFKNYTTLYYNLRVMARNDFNPTTGSCAINNGKQIDINFNEIRQDLLTTSVDSAVYRREQPISFNCQDASVNQGVSVKLIGDSSPFSSSYIKTSNDKIGVALLYNGITIKPGDSFASRINNGNGLAQVSFVAVKDNVDGKSIPVGELTGSASLVLSIP